jgi:hypothetical protein
VPGSKDSRLIGDRKVFNLDLALNHVGGFGWFQIVATFCLTIMRNSGMYLYYGFSFLVLEQKYLCRDSALLEFESCPKSEICSNIRPEFEFVTDSSNMNYLRNWQ